MKMLMMNWIADHLGKLNINAKPFANFECWPGRQGKRQSWGMGWGVIDPLTPLATGHGSEI